MTDYHCHILPGIDDGAADAEISTRMLELMWRQGVTRVVATPHFYAHREDGVENYLEKRRRAFDWMTETASQSDEKIPDEIYLGAEVAIEQGISRLPGIEKLRLADTPYILLELPYAPFGRWMLEEAEAISHLYGLTPILAHVHRYIYYYHKQQLEDLLRFDGIFQLNNSGFRAFGERRFSRRVIREGCPYLFGSDAHNMSNRRPDWDFLLKKVKPDELRQAENLFPE